MATYLTLKGAGKFCTATRYSLIFEKERLLYQKGDSFIRVRRDKRTVRGQKSETMVTDNYILVNKQAIQGMHGIIFSLSFFFCLLFIFIYWKFLIRITSVLFPRRSSRQSKNCLCQKTV